MTDSIAKDASSVLSKALDRLPVEIVTVGLVCATVSIVAWATHDGQSTVQIALIVTVFSLIGLVLRYWSKTQDAKLNLDIRLAQDVSERLSAYPDLSMLPCIRQQSEGAVQSENLPPVNQA